MAVAAPVYDEWPPRSHRAIFFASEPRDDERVYAREVIAHPRVPAGGMRIDPLKAQYAYGIP